MCKGHVNRIDKLPEFYLDINISFWNIHGFNSRLIGSKLKDTDFLKEIRNSHIVGLVETHIHDDITDLLAIPGFKLFSHKNGKKKFEKQHRAGRDSDIY